MSSRFIVILLLGTLLYTSACSAASASTPTLNAQGTYTLETRTGMEDIDQVIAAVASGERDRLENLIAYTSAPCTTRDGLGGPPKCRDGEADGTVIEAFPVLGSEGGFIRRSEIDQWTGVDADAIFAVYAVSQERVEEEYYPRGEYAVVFLSDENVTAVTLRLLDGRIVRADYPPYSASQELKVIVEQDASEVLLISDVP